MRKRPNIDRLKREEKKKDKRFKWWKAALFLLPLILILPILILGIWNWRNFSDASQKLFGSSNPTAFVSPADLDNDNGRVNILIVGYGIDQPNHGGSDLTDSILVLSLDQEANTGYMLSIPRDLYVDIPGRGQAKINEAFQAGEQSEFKQNGYPEGGIGSLEHVVNDVFAIDIHYYALVDFTTVKEVVNALDGITVTIDSDDDRGIFDPNFQKDLDGPLKLENGTHTIDGTTALKLTRARGATYGSYGFPQSDFNRTEHQQIVFAAIKEKLTWELVLDPRKNKDILDTFAEHVETDVELNEAFPLFNLLRNVPTEKIKSIGLHDINGQNLLTGYTTPYGQSALIPVDGINNYDTIQSEIQKLN